MKVILTIPGSLPNLNDYIRAERESRYKAAEMKHKAGERVEWLAKVQLRGARFSKPVTMHYLWIEKNMRRDKDNISSFGRKVIQDALVKSGVLHGDGWAHIKGFTDDFDVNPKCPEIVVTITDEE